MRTDPRHGFTLIELMIAVALLSFVTLAVSIVMVQQQRMFTNNDSLRAADESGRLASQTLTEAIINVGFGMDPNLAIDFQYYNCQTSSASSTIKTASCTTTVRNSSTGPDEMVFYSRNPSYFVSSGAPAQLSGSVWYVKNLTATSVDLTLDGTTPPTQTFLKGQILLLICPGGTNYLYATVGANSTAGNSTVSLATPVSPSAPFMQNNSAAVTQVASCIGSPATNAMAFLITRQRFFIAGYVGHPYLMYDRGIDLNQDGSIDDKDVVPIAADIEDMQVSYQLAMDPTGVMPLVDASGNKDNILYNVDADDGIAQPQDQIYSPTPCPTIGNLFYAQRCFFQRLGSDPIRFTANPANITAVNVAIVARAPSPDTQLMASRQNNILPAVYDRPAVDLTANYNNEYPAGTNAYGFRRTVVYVSAPTPNLSSRGQFMW